MKRKITNIFYFNRLRQSILALSFFMICNIATAQVYTYVSHNINTSPATLVLSAPCGGTVTVFCQDPSLALCGGTYTFNGCYLIADAGSNCQRMGLQAGGCISDPCCSSTADNDNDGVGDECDLDDDNDGIVDADEGCVIIPSGTGVSATSIAGGVGSTSDILDGINNEGASFNGVNETLIVDFGQSIPSGTVIKFDYLAKSNSSTKTIEISQSNSSGSTTINPVYITTTDKDNSHDMNYTLSADTRYIKLKMTVRTSGRIEVDYIEQQGSSSCVDTDGDGIPNNLDMDSDNDGCPDAIEGGGGFNYSQIQGDSTLNGGVDADGIPLLASGGQGLGTSQDDTQQSAECNPCVSGSALFRDDDNDGIGNWCDLDNDNDGIKDSDEGYCTSSSTETLAWENTGYSDEAVVASNTNFTVGSNVVTLEWNTVTDGGTFAAAEADFVTYESSKNGGHTGYLSMAINNSWSDPDDKLITKLSFQQAVTELKFDVLDVDEGSNFDDAIEVYYTTSAGTFNVRSNSSLYTLGGSSVKLDNESYMDGFEGDASASSAYAIGNVKLDFGGLEILSVEVHYFSTDDLGANPGSQYSGISDISFKSCNHTDTDGDGIANYLDMDSDNDGCPDALEGGGNFSSSQMQSDSTLTGSVDSDGIPTIASGGQTVGTSQDNTQYGAACDPCDSNSSGFVDSDNDGVGDACDLDKDNDGILDTDECVLTNIASNGTATQSSTGHGGDANRAIDGNTSGNWHNNSVTHTNTETNPYWELDLGSEEDIEQIVVWNRTDCCTDRLDNFILEIKDGNNNIVFTYNHQGSVNGSATVPVSVDGQHIKIWLSGSSRILSLAEVQVFSGCGDYDNDGIANHLDKDSDNDGCPDAIEGGAGFAASQMQSDSTLTGAVDSDGVPVLANGGQAVGTSQNNSQQSLVCTCTGANLDTTTINLTTCDPNATGTVTQTLTGTNGCDSTVITITTFNGGPVTTNLTETTCDPNAAGVNTQVLTGVNGCDSTVVTTTVYNGGPSNTVINQTTCDPNAAGLVTLTLTAANGCDSLVYINTVYNGGPVTTNLTATTCDPNAAGVTTQVLTGVNGCDSTVITTTTFNGGPSTTNLTATTCDPNAAGVTTQVLTGANGCDSTVITTTTFNGGPDTTVINLTSCDINSVGTTTQTLTRTNGCDSVIITNITLNTITTQGQCPGFRTQTQGGWGASPNGNNPGVYLHANFANAFPNGLVVGCTNTLTLTSAQAVTDFLPSGGGPQALTASFVDPTTNKGTFAGQVVALTLSVTFDAYDTNFGTSSYSLGDLIIQSGLFSGWTVQQLLNEANNALGGCNSIYNRSDLNDAVDNVNQSYVDGNISGSFLGCPPCITLSATTVDPSCALTADGSVDVTVSGGISPYSYSWSNGATTEDLTNVPSGVYNVTVTDVNGLSGTESVTLTAPPFATPTITAATTIGLSDIQDTRGVAFGDYDNDSYVDLFIPNYEIDSASMLYHNNGDGTFTKVTDANNPIVTDLAPSTSAVWGDYDNDGDIDLYVSNNVGYGNFLYRNEGNGSFVSIQNDPIVNYIGYSHGASWADYDNDGFLDMFVADYFSTKFNKLYHNNGDGTFSEVESSPLVTDASFSVSAVWGDYDNDRDQDLFVANTNGDNNFLYRNDGNGNFTKITTGDIVNDGGKSTGASWGDYDNDLDLDLFVTNAGGESNFLYENNGDGTFTKVLNSSVSLNGGHSHGSAWGDLDNDGDIDLVVGNDRNENNNMFFNNGDGTFTAQNNVVTQSNGNSMGLALADIDNDCDLDVHVSNIDQANFTYINDLSACNKKVCFTLVGTSANKLGYGAKVKILATINGTPTWQMRELAALSGGGLGGQNDSKVMFGVGDATQVDSVYVEWPSGYVQKLGPIAVNTCLCTQIVEQNGSTVCGSVYYDNNNDCTLNGTDEGLESIELVAQPGNIKAYTDEFGNYVFNLAPGTYTITQTNTNVWSTTCFTSYTVTVTGIGQQFCGNDFANTTSCPNPDLYIDLSTTALRVGFENVYAVTFGNNGAVAATNASVKVDFGADIIPLSASLPWDAQNGTEYTWNIGTIEMGQNFTVYVADSVSASAAIGSNIAVLGTISENGSTQNDCDATNNIETDINEAVGAIDPNDILVNPEGFIAVDQELTYRIRFQNVGNDLVNRVVLRDELPEGLDMSTLVRGVASHPYQFRIEGERTLVWEFNNINLPDSTTNEPESHGFATFRITPKADLEDGTELPNKAAIFFDFADPIITNTVINTIGEPNDEVKPGDLSIYPNPMMNFTTIRIVPRQIELNEEEIQSIEIFTMLGVKVMEMNSLTGTRVTIERGELSQGYYVVKVKSNKGNLYTGKLLVNNKF